MKTLRLLTMFGTISMSILAAEVSAGPISSTDLWDISQGSTINDTSGVLNYRSSYRSDIRDMFGGRFGTIDRGNTLFKDYNSPPFGGGSVQPGFVHYVEWQTPTDVTLRSFNLHAFNEGMDRRAFNRFTLYSSSTLGGSWSSVYDTGAGFTYNGSLDLEVDLSAPIVAQYFRAEFVQAPWTDSRAVGPRIQELDGFDTFLDGTTGPVVPEPASMALWGLGSLGIGVIARRRKKKATLSA